MLNPKAAALDLTILFFVQLTLAETRVCLSAAKDATDKFQEILTLCSEHRCRPTEDQLRGVSTAIARLAAGLRALEARAMSDIAQGCSPAFRADLSRVRNHLQDRLEFRKKVVQLLLANDLSSLTPEDPATAAIEDLFQHAIILLSLDDGLIPLDSAEIRRTLVNPQAKLKRRAMLTAWLKDDPDVMLEEQVLEVATCKHPMLSPEQITCSRWKEFLSRLEELRQP